MDKALDGSAAGRVAAGLAESFRSLSNSNFRLLAISNFLCVGGSTMDIVARSWMSYRLSGSGFAVGGVALGYGIAQIVVGIFTGTAADRLDKRKVLAATHLSLCAIAVAVALLIQMQLIQLWHLFIQGLLVGAIFPFSLPARQAYILRLVKREELSNAVAVDSSGKNLARMLGPAVEGVLLGWDPTFAYYGIAVLQLSSGLAMLRLPPSPPMASESRGALSEVVAGFQYAWRDSMMRMLLAMAVLTTLLGMSYQNLLPVFQMSVLHVSEAQLGLMYAATGSGALVASFLIAALSRHRRLELLQALAGVAFGIVLALFAVSGDFTLSIFLLFFLGSVSLGYVTLNNVVIMLHTRPELCGRMMSIYILTYGFVPIALLPLGASVDRVGAPITVAVAGILLALGMIALMLRFAKNLRKEVADDPRK